MKIAISVTEKEKARRTASAYFQALVASGARPEELALVSAEDSPRPRAEDFDGILFTGGEDIDPSYYGEKQRHASVYVNQPRDEFELALLGRALARRLPILGICRGAQVINVKFGGTLYQDLPSEATVEVEHRQPGSRSDATHSVTLTDRDSRLAAAFEGSCRVNSLHHQAIKRLGRGLKVIAHSEDGLAEAVEAADDYPFLLAVQWHPEEMADRAEQRKIFEQFLAKCREGAAQKRAGASS
jgi:putative glutamine amidotransferase